MWMEYSFDGNDWSPYADPYNEDLKKMTKGLIPFIFQGEHYIFNQYDGPLVDVMRQSELKIYFVYNGVWMLRDREPYLQINGSNKKDKVLFRVRIWF